MPSNSHILWIHMIKAHLSKFWMDRNSIIFLNKQLSWINRFESAQLKASSSCALYKSFADFYLHNIYLHWDVFIFNGSF